MGSVKQDEATIRLRVKLLRDLERGLAARPEASLTVLAAIRELRIETEAQLARVLGQRKTSPPGEPRGRR